MEFWTKAMVAVVAVVVVVVAVGSVYTYGEEPDPIEYKTAEVRQAASSSYADAVDAADDEVELRPDGFVWAYATVYVYNEEDVDFDDVEMPTLTLDGVTYEVACVRVVDGSDTFTLAHYKLTMYYAVAGFYDDGELVNSIMEYAELNFPDIWTPYFS